MAAITATDLNGTGFKAVTEASATASDTLTFKPSDTQVLLIRNDTGLAIDPVIKGDGVSATYPVQNGGGTKDLTAGLTINVADGAIAALVLQKNAAYMEGTAAGVTITAADGAELSLLEFS